VDLVGSIATVLGVLSDAQVCFVEGQVSFQIISIRRFSIGYNHQRQPDIFLHIGIGSGSAP
jgi:hypothetical protein